MSKSTKFERQQKLMGCCLFAIGFFVCVGATAQTETKLGALVGEALLSHPALRGQQGMAQAAQSGVEGARWQFYPTPSVAIERAGSQSNDPSYRGDNQIIIASLRQPLWTGGRLTSNLAKAQAQALAARADLETTRQQLALRVIQAWSEAVSAQNKWLAWEQSRATHERLLAMVERRTNEGASAHADVALARSRLAAIDADRLLAQAQRDGALERLQLLIGGRRLAVQALALELPPQDAERNPERWLDDARASSPQIIKARAMAQAADAEAEAARAAISPEVSLRLERQWGNFNIAGVGSQNRIFLAVSTAFGGGLSSLSNINAALARSRAAQEDIQTQQLTVDDQVQNDLLLWRASQQRRRSLQDAQAAASEITSSWERQFLAGRKNWQDLMNAAREQAQFEAQLSDVIGSEQLSGWRLFTLAYGVDALLAPMPNQGQQRPLDFSPVSPSAPVLIRNQEEQWPGAQLRLTRTLLVPLPNQGQQRP